MSPGKTLNLIASNVGDLTAAGHKILNAGIEECLQLGWVVHDPKKRIGYALTARGKAVMSAMRTGIPLPPVKTQTP
jgi:riboflavin synthase